MKVETINKDKFFKLKNVRHYNLVEMGLFNEEDFDNIRYLFGLLNVTDKIGHITKNELILAFKHPFKLIFNLPRILKEQISGVRKYYQDKNKSLNGKYPISDYALKASIVASFKPKSVLEIGTWYGWGISSIKTVVPSAICYTMNPKENAEANNPIEELLIGSFYRKKGLDIKQIWADSRKYDFRVLNSIDVCYIDGNHKYEYVYSDIENCAKIVKKALLLDDYIPNSQSDRGDVLMWGWHNRDVVRAVDNYLERNDDVFKEAYWIEGTPVCVLIK